MKLRDGNRSDRGRQEQAPGHPPPHPPHGIRQTNNQEGITMSVHVRSSIKAHTTAILQGIIAQASSLGPITNPTLKGELRELLIADLFSRFLVPTFGIGTGQIINQKEELSNQIDIIIYDKRILPPFVQNQNIGIYPAEAVVAVIEVKSQLYKKDIIETSEKNNNLLNKIYSDKASIYADLHIFKPLTSIVGFFDELNFQYENTSENRKIIQEWINENAPYLWSVCLMGKFSWLEVMRPEGVVHLRQDHLENTKAYLAILLDNIRSLTQKRYIQFLQLTHHDWFSIYLRDQNIERLFLRARNL